MRYAIQGEKTFSSDSPAEILDVLYGMQNGVLQVNDEHRAVMQVRFENNICTGVWSFGGDDSLAFRKQIQSVTGELQSQALTPELWKAILQAIEANLSPTQEPNTTQKGRTWITVGLSGGLKYEESTDAAAAAKLAIEYAATGNGGFCSVMTERQKTGGGDQFHKDTVFSFNFLGRRINSVSRGSSYLLDQLEAHVRKHTTDIIIKTTPAWVEFFTHVLHVAMEAAQGRTPEGTTPNGDPQAAEGLQFRQFMNAIIGSVPHGHTEQALQRLMALDPEAVRAMMGEVENIGSPTALADYLRSRPGSIRTFIKIAQRLYDEDTAWDIVDNLHFYSANDNEEMGEDFYYDQGDDSDGH